ncbi:hypothetical protein [Gordonia jinhuaensis]|nr:hypothetical protein [Gordonia jinhuaensis]
MDSDAGMHDSDAGRGDVGGEPDGLRVPTAAQVSDLKERIYVTFTGLAIVLALSVPGQSDDPAEAFAVLAVGILAVTAASLAADIIAHLVVHQRFPGGHELLHQVRTALGALPTSAIPLFMIGLAWCEVISLHSALQAAGWFYIAGLAAIVFLAIHRTDVGLLRKLMALLIVVIIALVVLLIQTLAHLH